MPSSSFVSDHCVEVFQYAAKHGYHKLMDDAGLIAVQNKYWARQISTELCCQPDIQSAWVQVSFITDPLCPRTYFLSSCSVGTVNIGWIYLMSAITIPRQSFTLAEGRIAKCGGNLGMWLSPK